MKNSRLKLSFDKATWILWLALVAALPVTSMPLVARLIHSSAVAPASLIFLGLLCISWIPVYIWRKGAFPGVSAIVILFLFIGLFTSAVSLLNTVPAYKDETVISNIISGLVTLVIGVLFYLVSSTLPNSSEKVKSTLRMINISGCVMLAWTLVVFIIDQYLTPNTDVPDYLRTIQHLFSTTTFFGDRFVGLTSEPSWFAHILNIVYLPYWAAATFGDYSAHQKRMWKVSLENVLLIVGAFCLFNTLSRVGLAAFLLVLGYYFVRFNGWLIRLIRGKWNSKTNQKLITFALVLIFIVIYISLAFGCVFALSKIDPRMQSVFSLDVIRKGGLVKYADLLKFGERLTYWQAGWQIFNDHPLLGVGVGNAGFYFPSSLPDAAWNLSEVRGLLYRSAGLMNIKSMWVRIMAEMGVIGFSVFLVILVISGLMAFNLTRSNSKMKKAVGSMGIGMLLAFLLEGFSVDSFALPYLWFTLGIIAASWRWGKSTNIEDQRNG